jgi:hypothetical protein
MSTLTNLTTGIFILLAIYLAIKGLLLSFRSLDNLLSTKEGALLKALYPSGVLISGTFAFEIKVQNPIYLLITPIFAAIIWWEYLINMPIDQNDFTNSLSKNFHAQTSKLK